MVIYRYTGSDVASPALGSAGRIMSRVAYGLALPTVSKNKNCAAGYLLTSVVRSSLLESLMVTLLVSTFTYAYSGIRTTCMRKTSWPSAVGWRLQRVFGSLPGSLRRPFLSSATCWVSSRPCLPVGLHVSIGEEERQN